MSAERSSAKTGTVAGSGAAPAAGPEGGYPKNKWTIAIAVTFGTLMGTIDTSIINVAMPHLRGTLSATLEEITWISTGYVVASVIIMPLTAWLGTRYGRKRVYMAGLVLFLVGSFFCGTARSLVTLVFFRILQGIGAGALQPTEQAILRETFPPAEQGKAMALYGFAIMLGPAIGPTLGGYIVDNYSWPWIFYINIPIGVLGLVMVWRTVQDPPYLERKKVPVDWAGLILLVVGLAAVQTLLEQGERDNWFDSRLNVAYLVISLASLLLFIVTELSVKDPMVNLRVLKNRSFAVGSGIGAVLGAILFSSLFLLPVYMQELLRFDAMQSGLALMPRSLAMLFAIPVVGQVYNRLSPKLVVTFGLVLGGISCLQMSRFTLLTSSNEILIPQVVQGIALACIFIPLQTVALATVSRKDMSQSTGLMNLIRQVGGSMGIAVFASLLGRFTTRARGALTDHLSMTDPAAFARVAGMKQLFLSRGADPTAATSQAMKMLDLQVLAQSSMLAFEKAFFLGGLLFLASVPLVLLLDDSAVRKRAASTKHDEHLAVEL